MQGTVLIFCCFAINVFVLWISGYVAIRHFFGIDLCYSWNFKKITDKTVCTLSTQEQKIAIVISLIKHAVWLRLAFSWGFDEKLSMPSFQQGNSGPATNLYCVFAENQPLCCSPQWDDRSDREVRQVRYNGGLHEVPRLLQVPNL